VYERGKTFELTESSRKFNGKVCPPELFRKFRLNVFEEIERYKQVSFTKKYRDGIEGFASPMMWGHYARDYQRSGVCIELDSTKIKLPKKIKIYKHSVSYNKALEAIHIGGVNAEMEDAAEKFVRNNINQLFFIKHFHWKFENEYRYISKEDNAYLDVTGAITSVYVLGEDNVTLQSIKGIVKDTKMIFFLNVGGLNILKLNPMSLCDYEDLKELMNNINKNK